jgi:hypothetical protein
MVKLRASIQLRERGVRTECLNNFTPIYCMFLLSHAFGYGIMRDRSSARRDKNEIR